MVRFTVFKSLSIIIPAGQNIGQQHPKSLPYPPSPTDDSAFRWVQKHYRLVRCLSAYPYMCREKRTLCLWNSAIYMPADVHFTYLAVCLSWITGFLSGWYIFCRIKHWRELFAWFMEGGSVLRGVNFRNNQVHGAWKRDLPANPSYPPYIKAQYNFLPSVGQVLAWNVKAGVKAAEY